MPPKEKPIPSNPSPPPPSRGTKRRYPSDAPHDDGARASAAPRPTQISAEEQLQRDILESDHNNRDRAEAKPAPRRKRLRFDPTVHGVELEEGIRPPKGKDRGDVFDGGIFTPRKKRAIGSEEKNRLSADTTDRKPTGGPPTTDSPNVPPPTPIPRRKKTSAIPSTPHPSKKRPHASTSGLQQQQTTTQPHPRAPAPVPSVSSRPPAVNASTTVKPVPFKPVPFKPPTRPSFELPGDAYMRRRETERRGRKEEEQNEKGRGQSPTKPEGARAHQKAPAEGKNGGGVDGAIKVSEALPPPPPPAPPEPLESTAAPQPPPVSGLSGPTEPLSNCVAALSEEQQKLAAVMRVRTESAMKGMEAARAWAEQQKAKVEGGERPEGL